VAKGVGAEFKPQYHVKTKQNMEEIRIYIYSFVTEL
jgi:hypothetical protein